MKIKYIILLISLLVIIDQGVKLIVYASLMDANYEIIPNFLDFKPVFNSRYSYFNDSLYNNTRIDIGVFSHVILFALLWFLIFLQYRFYKSIVPNNKSLDVLIALFTSSLICGYLGIFVWEKGVLDFLYFKMLSVICDIKDIYINIFVVLLLITTTTIEVRHKLKFKDKILFLKGFFRKNI